MTMANEPERPTLRVHFDPIVGEFVAAFGHGNDKVVDRGATELLAAFNVATRAERERCAKVCEARMEHAERESGAEAAGHLEAVAEAIRRGG